LPFRPVNEPKAGTEVKRMSGVSGLAATLAVRTESDRDWLHRSAATQRTAAKVTIIQDMNRA